MAILDIYARQAGPSLLRLSVTLHAGFVTQVRVR